MRRWAGLAGSMWVLGVVVPAQAQTPAPESSVIIAQGEASLTEAPDRAYLDIASEGRAAKTGDAQRIAAQGMTTLQAALRNLGLPADAIRSTGYELQPEYDYVDGRQKFRDVLARHTIEVRVDDFAKLGDVLDSAGASGATSVSGLRFDLKDRNTVEHEALTRAVRDGVERAQAMATGAGRSVAAIVRIQEQRSSAPVSEQFRTLSASAPGGSGGFSTPIAPGEIEIRAQVTVTMAIK